MPGSGHRCTHDYLPYVAMDMRHFHFVVRIAGHGALLFSLQRLDLFVFIGNRGVLLFG